MLNKVSRVTVLAIAITVLVMVIQTASVEAITKEGSEEC